MKRVGIDLIDEGFAGIKEFTHGGVAMVVGKVFAHPLPESFNRVEVWTVARQRQEGETHLRRCGLNDFGPIARRSIPDNENRRGDRSKPVGEMVEKLDGIVTVAATFVPDEALTLGEVIGTVPVNPILQGWAIAQAPGGFACLSPGVAQVHVALEVGFIDVDQPHLFLTELGKGGLELLDEGGSFLWIGFLEQLLAFLPTQMVVLEKLAQDAAAHFTAKELLDPTAQLLHGPVVAR